VGQRTRHISILQFDVQAITLLRVRQHPKEVDVVAYEQTRGHWSVEDGSLERALRDFVDNHGIVADTLYTILPRYEMTARVIELPTQEPDEIRSMIALSAEEYVPFAASDLVMDQCTIGTTDQGEARVLAVFAHKDVVETHLRMLSGAGIEPTRIFVSTACLLAAVQQGKPGNQERLALLDLTGGGIEAVIVNGDRFEYGRAVAATHDWDLQGPGGDEAAEELLIETRQSLSAYRRESEDGQGIDSIYLSSPLTDLDDTCEFLGRELDYPCHPARFGLAVITRGADRIAQLPLTLLGGALGALGRSPYVCDLVPPRIRQARRAQRAKAKGLQLGAALLLLVLSLGVWYGAAAGVRQRYLDELESKIEEVNPRIEGVLEQQRQLELLQGQVARTDTVLELWADVCAQAPVTGLNITRFTYKRGTGVYVDGRARSRAQIETFGENLRSIERFARAREQYTNERQERDRTVMEFAIDIPFSTDDEEGTS